MDGIGAARHGGSDDRLLVEVGLGRMRRADLGDRVGQPRRQHLPVGRADGLDRADAHRSGGAHDAHGDLAPVRDEERADRHGPQASSS